MHKITETVFGQVFIEISFQVEDVIPANLGYFKTSPGLS
jgi:hypothetical protein